MPRGMDGAPAAPAMLVGGVFEDVDGAKIGIMKYFSLCIGRISSNRLPEIPEITNPQNITY